MRISTTVTATIEAPRQPLYEWLVPHVFAHELHTVLRPAARLPGVERTSPATGPWDEPGSTRIVYSTDGHTARDEVLAADTPHYFAYRVTDFSQPYLRPLVRHAEGRWWFIEDGGGTQARWTYEFESRSALAAPLLAPMVKLLWNRYMRAAMRITQERAAREVARD